MSNTPFHRLRDAVLSDLPAIVAIYNDTVPSRMVTADLEPVSVASREIWFAEHGRQTHPLWVAEAGGEILGWLSYSALYRRAAYNRTAELSIYIAREQRRRGLGQVLLAKALAHAPTVGIDNLVGLVFAHNQPSLALFEKHGFARWGFLPQVCRLDGVERDVVILGRRVPPHHAC